MSEEVPDTRDCPDCTAESGDGVLPLGAFYRIKAPKYAGGYRYSVYCKRHTKARNLAVRKNAPEGSGLREAIRKANRESNRRYPEANRARVAAYRARKKRERE